MIYTAKIRLSESTTLIISYDDTAGKATITEANSGKTGSVTLADGGAKRSTKKEAE